MLSDLVEVVNLERVASRPVVLVTIVETSGSTPRKAGSQMLVLADGTIRGTIGGGLAEAQAMAEAGRAFQSRSSSVRRMSMNASVAASEGMACGGDMEIFIQYVEAQAP